MLKEAWLAADLSSYCNPTIYMDILFLLSLPDKLFNMSTYMMHAMTHSLHHMKYDLHLSPKLIYKINRSLNQ